MCHALAPAGHLHAAQDDALQESWAHVSKKQKGRERFEQTAVTAGGLFKASSKLELFIVFQLSLLVHRKTDASHSQAPCFSHAPSAKPTGRVHKQGGRHVASCLWLLWASDRTLSIPHTSLASLAGYQASSQHALCFSYAVRTAAASAHKQGREARACQRFGSNSERGALMTVLGSKPGLPEAEQLGTLTTRLPFIFQH